MKLSSVAAFAALVLGQTMAQAQETNLTYKGLTIGVNRAEFVTKFPDYTCRPTGACSYELRRCRGDLRGASAEAVADYSARGQACQERNSLGGAYVESATAWFRDEKLYQVTFNIPSSNIEKVIKAASERYGPPKRFDETPVQNKMGASFPNVKATWELGGDYMSATQHLGRIGDGYVMITTVDELKRADDERKAGVKKGATDF